MEAKWPFIVIVVTLLFGMGYLMASLERNTVMANWTERRCELPVIMTARFFKPESDPRTASDFSSENFNFCMQSSIEKFMTLFMGPIQHLFGKQINITAGLSQVVNTARTMAQTMYNAFMSYLQDYFKKFHSSVFQMSRIIQHLRMAANRISAIAMSMIYAGIALFRGMLNSIQAVIRVVLIICAIMLAIIIILFFVLFPVIPMILSTLTAVVTIVVALGAVMSSSVAADANSKKSGFCFAPSTRVSVLDKKKGIILKSVEDIQLDDEMVHVDPHTGERVIGKVTERMIFSGERVAMYERNGIHVSGSHLVYQPDQQNWMEVEKDSRFHAISATYSNLYCFNTTTNVIPVVDSQLNLLLFRDWEELEHTDSNVQKEWIRFIYEKLNPSLPSPKHLDSICETPLLSPSTPISTLCGWLSIRQMSIGDYILDEYGAPQKVLGIVYGKVNLKHEKETIWRSAVYQWEDDRWEWKQKTYEEGSIPVTGIHLITEKGTVVCWNMTTHREEIIRDFTEVGHEDIKETYDFVTKQLRIKNI